MQIHDGFLMKYQLPWHLPKLKKVKAWDMTIWSVMVKVVKALWLHEIRQASLFLLTGGTQRVNAQTAKAMVFN